MTERRGEKIGCTAGWMGGFIWVEVFSVVFIVQGKLLHGCLGLVLACVAIGCILFFLLAIPLNTILEAYDGTLHRIPCVGRMGGMVIRPGCQGVRV